MDGKMLEHSFSVELNSKDHVRLVALDTDRNKTLIEGFLGELIALDFVEDILLEIKGKNGTLRIDLDSEDLKKLSHHKNKEVFQK
ncbi:hypothetical protein E2P60_02580 [Candidatus Bathyarchaeota archaeon]|nr:hypothetical protein E2P60_02580 [Candidatus Bathyarchaeota archaeon]